MQPLPINYRQTIECYSCQKYRPEDEFREFICFDCWIQIKSIDAHYKEITCLECKQRKKLPVDSTLRICLECDKEIDKILER